MSRIALLNSAALIAVVSSFSVAKADMVLPPLSVSGFATLNGGGTGTSHILTSTITNNNSVPAGALVESGGNSAGASVTAGFTPLLQAEVILGNQLNFDNSSPTGHAEAQLTYYFSLTGPNNGPIQGFATGNYSLTAPVFPNGDGSFPRVFGSFSYGLTCIAGTCGINNIYPGTESSTVDPRTLVGQQQPYITAFQLDPNSVYEVDLGVSIDVGGINQSGLATIDPMFSTNVPGYTFTFSPELFAASAPEPSTWAMMVLGFAGIGFMAYRRKSKPTLIAA